VLSGLQIQSRLPGRLIMLLGVSWALLLSGCGKQKQTWETVYPARGTVTYKGQPVANAEIAFFPQDDSMPETIRPRAKTTEDGEFVVWTYQQGDGAPAGNYKVTVVHHNIVEVRDVLVTRPNDLPPKYARLQTTDLVAEIGEGETELPPFELQ